MRRMDIAIVKLDTVVVHDFLQDGDWFNYEERGEPLCVVENNPALHVSTRINDFIDIKNLRVREFWRVENGVRTSKLIAIHPKVYEELYRLEDDELKEEVLNDHQSQLRAKDSQYEYMRRELNRFIDDGEAKIKRLTSAKLFTRIKWIFTGVKG